MTTYNGHNRDHCGPPDGSCLIVPGAMVCGHHWTIMEGSMDEALTQQHAEMLTLLRSLNDAFTRADKEALYAGLGEIEGLLARIEGGAA